MKARVNPVGRLDVAAVSLLGKILLAKAPNVHAALFDSGQQEKSLKVAAAKLLGPRSSRHARGIQKVARLIAADMHARRLG